MNDGIPRSPAEGVAREVRRALREQRAAEERQKTGEIEDVGRALQEADRLGLRTPEVEAAAADAFARIIRATGPRRRRVPWRARQADPVDAVGGAAERHQLMPPADDPSGER